MIIFSSKFEHIIKSSKWLRKLFKNYYLEEDHQIDNFCIENDYYCNDYGNNHIEEYCNRLKSMSDNVLNVKMNIKFWQFLKIPVSNPNKFIKNTKKAQQKKLNTLPEHHESLCHQATISPA